MIADTREHDEPLVSVVVATFNMGQHVVAAIDSILGQTWRNLEVIVVDDGSNDDTLERLERYQDDPRVSILAQPNRGQPKAKNAGIGEAVGNFIAFCDADDMWLPEKLALQMPIFRSNPRVGVVYSPAITFQRDGTGGVLKGPQYLRGDVLEAMFLRNIVPFGTAVVRRACLDQAGKFDESIAMGIDWDLWLRIALDWEFDFVPEPTYVYRIWDGQMSRNWRGRYEHAFRIMERFLALHPDRLPLRLVATAYADTYTNLAREELQNVGIRACIATLGKALRTRITFWPAWRLLLSAPWHRIQALRRETTRRSLA